MLQSVIKRGTISSNINITVSEPGIENDVDMASVDPETHTQKRSGVTMTTCEEVFGTVELLDLILGFVMRKDSFYHQARPPVLLQVLNLQRVNKTFYNQIYGRAYTAQSLFSADACADH